jgi:bacteriocin-type transport-associated protein
MTEVLIQQLNNSDINWMIANGSRQQLASNTLLIRQQSNVNSLYIVLDGCLTATVKSNSESVLEGAFSALEDDSNLEQEIDRFSSGDVVGETSFLNLSPAATAVTATEKSTVLVLPRQKLLGRLRQDAGFACRFYRAIAILLQNRFDRLIQQFIRRQNLKISPLQDIPLLFGELSDSDVDWIVRYSHVEEIAADTMLIRANRPVDTLYLLLRGTASVAFSENSSSSFASVFSMLENLEESDESSEHEIAQLTRGEITGEMALIDNRLSAYSFKALDNLQVLAIDKQKLSIELQQNSAMGTRFLRAIAMLISARMQALIGRIGYGRSSYSIGESLSQDYQYADEIDVNMMDDLSLGGARFDWMLKRLKILV